jgi:hypothetical protein
VLLGPCIKVAGISEDLAVVVRSGLTVK